MKTYQYQHTDGRVTDKQFTSDRTALQFLEAIGPKWQLVTPICDVQPIPAAPAHTTPEEVMQEASIWIQAALELFEQDAEGNRLAITSGLQTALGRLQQTYPARVRPAGLVLAVGSPCTDCGPRNCLNSDAPVPMGVSVVGEPTVLYGQPNSRGQNEAAADNGFAS